MARPSGGGFELGDSIELTHYAVEGTFTGNIPLDGGPEVTAVFGGAGVMRDPSHTPETSLAICRPLRRRST